MVRVKHEPFFVFKISMQSGRNKAKLKVFFHDHIVFDV